MKLDRNTFEWGSTYGKVKVCDMADSHVLNVLGFMKERAEHYPGYGLTQQPYINLFLEEISIRRLDIFYLLKRLELMPWQCTHTKDGKKKKWDWNKGAIVDV